MTPARPLNFPHYGQSMEQSIPRIISQAPMPALPSASSMAKNGDYARQRGGRPAKQPSTNVHIADMAIYSCLMDEDGSAEIGIEII